VYQWGKTAWIGREGRSRFTINCVSAVTPRLGEGSAGWPAKSAISLCGILRCLAFVVSVILCLAPFLHPDAGSAAPREVNAKIRIAFAGDSLVDNYWAGMARLITASRCLKDRFELGRFARISTGLAHGDRVYWPREIRRINDIFKPTLTVISIGLNDRQFIVDADGGRTARGAPDWTDKYRHEIMEFLQGAIASKAIVLFMGLPVMRDSLANTDAAEKNSMFAETIEKIGAPDLHYVEPWKLNASGPDTFSSYGRDSNGVLAQIRAPDGEHFTSYGEDHLAHYLLPRIIAALGEAGIIVEQCPSTQTEH
jgi:hypothetical protein